LLLVTEKTGETITHVRKHNGEKSKSMELPRHVTIGHNALDNITDICNKLQIKGPSIIVVDENTQKIAGDHVEELLQGENYNPKQILINDANLSNLEYVKSEISKIGARFVLGVGGGRPIDLAKLSSFQSQIPFISIPTAASHDGIVSSQASIKDNGNRVSFKTHSPLAVIADTKIIADSPYRLLAAGAGDVVSNLSAVKDWILAKKLRSEYFSSSAAMLSEMSANMIIESSDMIKPRLGESAWIVAKALVSSGVAMSIAGSSRPASGSEHMFSHALDKIAPKPAYHGEQCAVGSIMMMYLHGGDWQKMRDALIKIKVPVTAKEMKIDDEYIIKALTQAHTIREDRYTILSGGLTPEAAEELAIATKVIG
jgi:glycerol-1-phosphate dehydrogenase [NAD(P)+]